MILQTIKEVEKTWGYERWIINTPDYCGKELFVKFLRRSSKGKYHYHILKDETFYVIFGRLKLDYVDRDIFRTIYLETNQAFRIEPGVKHRFTTMSIYGCKFIEFSTEHSDDDSYRGEYIKGEWIE